MTKVLMATVLLAVSGAASAGELEAQKAAAELSGKTGGFAAAGAVLPQPGLPKPVLSPADGGFKYYDTRCYMQDGDTVGMLFNLSDEVLHYSGKIMFYYYDKYGQLTDDDWSIDMGTIWPGERGVIKESGAPGDAEFCAVDARAAVSSGHVLIGSYLPPVKTLAPREEKYKTSCRLENGQAVGVIRNLSPESFAYSGSVSFYFYNGEGAMVDENLTMASGTVDAYKSQVLVNNGIPLRAESCGLDISAAMKR
ncbi:MAG TPA: hypothetical protein PKI19_06615 [Elusimicrobiales bacterium]|nr:hypothetical protein [Elusimicrobiales bacterium]